MSRSRFQSVLAAVMVVGMILAGCSGQKPAPSAPAAPPAPAATPPATPPAEPKPTNLVIYSALAEYETQRLVDKFSKQTGIKTEFIRLSAGQLVARVQAEKDAPKGDVILGGASDNHEALMGSSLLRAYKSPTAKDIDPKFLDPNGYWSGFYVGALGIAINTDRFKKDFPNEKEPASWDDLLNPKFKKAITIATPASSGTAYTFVATQIFRLGEDKAWDYLKQFDANVAQYTTSGSAPALQVASGEFTLGIAFGHDIMKPIASGYKLKMVYPKQTGSEIGAVSIIKGDPNPKAAEMFVDWMLGQDAGQIHSDVSLRISTRKDVTLPPGAIPLDQIDLVKYDGKWAGDNHDRVIKQWNSLFSK